MCIYDSLLFQFAFLCEFLFGGLCGEVGGTTLHRREVGGVSMALCPLLTDDQGSSRQMALQCHHHWWLGSL